MEPPAPSQGVPPHDFELDRIIASSVRIIVRIIVRITVRIIVRITSPTVSQQPTGGRDCVISVSATVAQPQVGGRLPPGRGPRVADSEASARAVLPLAPQPATAVLHHFHHSDCPPPRAPPPHKGGIRIPPAAGLRSDLLLLLLRCVVVPQ